MVFSPAPARPVASQRALSGRGRRRPPSSAAKKARIEASGLAKAKASEPVVFNDDVGYIALLVAGAYPQKPMKGQKGQMLCLFERSTGKASAEEAAGWRW